VPRKDDRQVLGVCGNPLAHHDGRSPVRQRWFLHHSFGTIVNRLAERFSRVVYHGHVLPQQSTMKADCLLEAGNLTVQPWDTWYNTMRATRRPIRLLRHYWRLARACDAVFIRGTPPLIWTLHLMAALRGMRVVHWIAADSVKVVRAAPRGYGRGIERLGLVYAHLERGLLRVASRISRAYIVTSGLELAAVYPSRRTVGCESTSTTSLQDFKVREDTCTHDPVRVLFLGFVRAEKGIEYLIRALPRLETDRRVELALVGGWDQFPEERTRLTRIIDELGLTDRVHWEGYARYGPELFLQIDRADMLVLPSLSEGTPHVLIECRSRSVPVVATRVGGIPYCITDGEDGLLVPPKDPAAIAAAISRIIDDGDLRRSMIRKGRERVSRLTVEWFCDLVYDLLTRPDKELLNEQTAAHGWPRSQDPG